MIPKSVVELTINILENDLSELETVNSRIIERDIEGYSEPIYISAVRNNIDIYKLLVKEYKKYLEENYSNIKTETSGFTKSVIERIQAENSQKENEQNKVTTSVRKGYLV